MRWVGRSVGRGCVAALVAAGTVLAAAASGGASDGFVTPSVATVTVAAGGSATVAETVHLDAAPAKADVVLAFDTTGSMIDALGQASSAAASIVTGVQAKIAGARFAVTEFQDYAGTAYDATASDVPYRLDQALTSISTDVAAHIPTATGDGGDGPEAYNRALFEAYGDAALSYDAHAAKLLIVFGDEIGHDAAPDAAIGPAACPATGPTDPGFDGQFGTADDLTTKTVLDGLKAHAVKLLWVSFASDPTIQACQKAMVSYANGVPDSVASGFWVDGTATGLGNTVVKLVADAAAHVGGVSLAATQVSGPAGGAASWISAVGPAGALTAPTGTTGGSPDPAFTLTIAPPADAAPGTYRVDLQPTADGASRGGVQHLDITVKAPLSALTFSSTSTVGAGVDQLPIGRIPNAWISFFAGSTQTSPVGSTPVGSTPVGSTPVGSTPVGSTPVGSTPVGSTPVGSTPVGSTPVGSTGLLDLPVGSTPVGSTALSSLLLSQILLCGDAPLPGTTEAQCRDDKATWHDVLAGTQFDGRPLNALSLADAVGSPDVKGRLKALPMRDVSFATSLFQSVRWTSLLVGATPLESLPVPSGFDSWCGGASPTIGSPVYGGSCTNVDASTTVLQMDVGGQLGSAPVGSTPVGSTAVEWTPVGSTPVGSTPVGSTAVRASKLASIDLSTIVPIEAVVDCSKLNGVCTGKTLGDAAATPGAIVASATFATPALVTAMHAAGITLNDILVAILGAAGLPWEQLPVQGLQPYSTAPAEAAYQVGLTADCSLLGNGFDVTVRLPRGFFPDSGALIPGNAPTVAFGTGAPQPLAQPPSVVGLPTAAASAAAGAPPNDYRWTLTCPSGATGDTTVQLAFKAYVGLSLGRFTSSATAAAAAFSISSTAPVTVAQNGEPGNDDPAAPPTVAPDTLVVGHLGSSGDQDFYRVSLDGLPRGTKVAVFLQVPHATDLDLSVSRPATRAFFSAPVGSTPVGSTPIEDSGIGFAAAGQSFPSETLQDVPVGSTPVGSTPVGSTPVGSTSTTRGDANEAAQIITTGEAGDATIDVTGYNGISSNEPYVLRVHETPPPVLPAQCPARGFAVSAANQGTLPATLPTSTKSVFLVDKQRLLALYPSLNWASFLATLNKLAARPEVGGSVLPVDGNPVVRAAYAGWDASPCDVDRANTVVRSINDVVASYRNTAAGLPNLHYVVLLGSDEAIPMARTPDPVTLSPEENEAADLAFTTNGLTAGNALYTSAATNNILTDGAYGAFQSVPWLGHDLLLPQLSVARLVETPAEILGQVNRYLGLNGLAAPQTAAGTLNPKSILPTGYDFLADGAQAVRDNLHTVGFPGATIKDTVGAGGAAAINVPGLPGQTPWTADDLRAGFLQSASPADIGSLNAHYNHYELEAADGSSLARTGDATAALAARILFTMGCHGGLNVADTLGGTGGPYLDWAQTYAAKQAAMYIANTGYGYGDTASVALSERLLAIFAKNLHSDANSVGEEWAASLQQYYATAGAYDVYDEKVLEETTFYGLPFWHFSSPSSSATFTPLTTSADSVTGVQSATIAFPGAAAVRQTQFGLYRPTLPMTSQEVTSALPARGLWIKSLQTTDQPGATATVGLPTIDLSAHEPKPAVHAIFFPASPFTLERSNLFGRQRAYVNVSDQFRPDAGATATTGTQRHVSAASLEVFYSSTPDRIAPLITQVSVTFDGSNATVSARVTDDSGSVAEVAALVNDGAWHYLQLVQSPQDPTLFAATIAAGVTPEVFVEATDGANVGYSANKGSNFTSASTSSVTPPGPPILLQAPVGPYGVNEVVAATYQCTGATTCVGTVANGQNLDTSKVGLHSFTVTATDAGGNVSSLQRYYLVSDLVLKASVSPAAASAGQVVLASASLTNAGSVDRDVTLTATFALNSPVSVTTPPLTFKLPAGKTFGGAIPVRIPAGAPRGAYSVTLRATDVTGTVTATATLTVG